MTLLNSSEAQAPTSLEADSVANEAERALKRQNETFPPAETAPARPQETPRKAPEVNGDARGALGSKPETLETPAGRAVAVAPGSLSGNRPGRRARKPANGSAEGGQSVADRNTASEPGPACTTGGPAKKPATTRGPELSNRKGYIRLTGAWLRKLHLEWKDQEATPGRAMAISSLLKTGAAILDKATSEKEAEEADKLFRLVQQMRAGKVGHA